MTAGGFPRPLFAAVPDRSPPPHSAPMHQPYIKQRLLLTLARFTASASPGSFQTPDNLLGISTNPHNKRTTQGYDSYEHRRHTDHDPGSCPGRAAHPACDGKTRHQPPRRGVRRPAWRVQRALCRHVPDKERHPAAERLRHQRDGGCGRKPD